EFLSKHIVLRSASDAAELDAIEAAFPDLDATARRDLYAKRKLHKATVLLLHELGHALGAIHTTQRNELMYPSYSADMNGFAESTRAVLRISLESRESATERGVISTQAARMLELLKRTPSGTWNQEDFEARVKGSRANGSCTAKLDLGEGSFWPRADGPSCV
ncbi:MAG TPA: matrixin family metalloprotease, partial [Polyangiaceae bacterium]|nr:matrixin family metalloprotease [Polyangiaceae bacterium]